MFIEFLNILNFDDKMFRFSTPVIKKDIVNLIFNDLYFNYFNSIFDNDV